MILTALKSWHEMLLRCTARFFVAAALAALSALPVQADVTVYCAASLTDLIGVIANGFEEATGEKVQIVPGASSTLARQIAAGAPADVYISANVDWIDYTVERAGFADPQSFTSNRLVIVAPAGATAKVSISDLPELLGTRRLALGDPAHVPAGQYAREALENAGVWDQLEARLAPASDVRAALAFVERGVAPFGIVYATDAQAGDVEIAGEIDPALHAPIIYYLAHSPTASDSAGAFIAALNDKTGKRIQQTFGFAPIETGDH